MRSVTFMRVRQRYSYSRLTCSSTNWSQRLFTLSFPRKGFPLCTEGGGLQNAAFAAILCQCNNYAPTCFIIAHSKTVYKICTSIHFYKVSIFLKSFHLSELHTSSFK